MMWRVLFYSASLVLWLAVAAIGVEGYAVFQAVSLERAANAYGWERSDAIREADDALMQATAANAPEPPAEVRWDLPAREGFGTLGEEGRNRLAADRGELILLCDGKGRVLSAYAPPEPKEIAELGGVAVRTESIIGMLPPREGRDALDAIADVWARACAQTREYVLSLPVSGESCFEFHFAPLAESAGLAEPTAVFVRRSHYQNMWRAYRAHVYRRDLYYEFLHSEFWTNSLGFRDEEVCLPKPPGVYRIVCIGGSTTVEGPRNDLTYPNLLEQRLRRLLDTERIEVINCGVDAVTSFVELDRLPDYLALQPDLIIHYNFVNDVLGVYMEAMAAAEPRAALLKHTRSVLGRSLVARRHFRHWLMPARAHFAAVIRGSMIARLKCMQRQAEAAGVSMAICSFAYPDLPNLLPLEKAFLQSTFQFLETVHDDVEGYATVVDVYNELVRDLCKAEGIRYIPVAEELKGGMDYFADVCHMHVAGIERKADIVFDHLKDYVAAHYRPS